MATTISACLCSLLFLLCLAFEDISFHEYSTAASDINNVCCVQVALLSQRPSQRRLDSPHYYWASIVVHVY